MSGYIIAFVGAFFAGCINTLAGNGSAITLTILTEVLGLPGNMANGTNRIGVLTNGFGATMGFYRGGRLDLKEGKWYIWPVFLGALIGIVVATKVSNEQFMSVFKYLMLLMFLVILIKPKRWLAERKGIAPSKWILIPVFLGVGFYGGFIQMGMGIFFLAALVLLAKYPIIEGNALKAFTVLLYGAVAVVIFAWNDLIDWKIGLLMGVGQLIGSWATARFASHYKGIEIWAYRLLVIAVLLSLFRLFDIF